MQAPYSTEHLRWGVPSAIAVLDARYLELMFRDDLDDRETEELNGLIAAKEAQAERMGL